MTAGVSRAAQFSLRHSRPSPPSCPTSPLRHSRPLPSVMPDVLNLPLLSFPTSSIGNPRAFPMQGHTNEKPEEKNPGFPLKTGGNDRRGKQGHTIFLPSFPTSFPLRHSRHPQSGIHGLFPYMAAQMKGQKRKTLDSRYNLSPTFVIGEPAGMTAGASRAAQFPLRHSRHPPSVIPDVLNRESTAFSHTWPHE